MLHFDFLHLAEAFVCLIPSLLCRSDATSLLSCFTIVVGLELLVVRFYVPHISEDVFLDFLQLGHVDFADRAAWHSLIVATEQWLLRVLLHLKLIQFM